MTENEALKILRISPEMKKEIPNLAEVYEVAVKALEEMQQYRTIGTVEQIKAIKALCEKQEKLISAKNKQLADFEAIGTVEEFKALKEKSVAKKVIIWADGSEHCPCCDFDNSAIGYGVCIDCGQKLDWSE